MRMFCAIYPMRTPAVTHGKGKMGSSATLKDPVRPRRGVVVPAGFQESAGYAKEGRKRPTLMSWSKGVFATPPWYLGGKSGKSSDPGKSPKKGMRTPQAPRDGVVVEGGFQKSRGTMGKRWGAAIFASSS